MNRYRTVASLLAAMTMAAGIAAQADSLPRLRVPVDPPPILPRKDIQRLKMPQRMSNVRLQPVARITRARIPLYGVPRNRWCGSSPDRVESQRVEVDVIVPREPDGSFIPANLIIDHRGSIRRKRVSLGGGEATLISDPMNVTASQICANRCLRVRLEAVGTPPLPIDGTWRPACFE